MFGNVLSILKKIYDNEEAISKIEKLDDWDEIYQEFTNIDPTCDEFEFYRFLVFLLECITCKKIRVPVSDEGLFLYNDIDDVSGGNSWTKRAAAATLALSTAFVGGSRSFFGNSAKAVDLNNPKATIRPLRTKNYEQVKKTEKSEKVGMLSKIKNKLKSFGSAIWENKGKLLLGAGLILGAVALTKHGIDNYRLTKNINTLDEALDKTGSEDTDVYAEDDDTIINGTPIKSKNRKELQKLLTSEKRKQRSYSIFNGTPIAGLGLLTATIGGMWDKGLSFIETVGRIGDSFKKAGDGLEKVQKGVEDATKKAALAASMIQKEDYDKESAYETMLEELETVKGQERAKRQVKSFYHRVVSDRERSEYTGKNNTAKVVVFNGPSGCGKSMTANILAKALTTGTTYTMSASEVDPKNGASLGQQLFAKNSWSWGEDDASFSGYLKKNPHDGVVIINEYDKMFTPKGTSPHELDEVLRTFMDEGSANLYGKEFNCSGTTFILTTNESDASLKGEVKADAYGNLFDPSIDEDDTGSLTSVVHDKSFLNRLTAISFDNLNADEFTEIAKQNFASTLEFLSSEYGDYTDVLIDEESYKRMGKCLAIINEGARPVNKFLASMFVSIVEEKNKVREQGLDVKGLTFRADFDYKGRDFWFNVELVEENEGEGSSEQPELTEETKNSEITENVLESEEKPDGIQTEPEENIVSEELPKKKPEEETDELLGSEENNLTSEIESDTLSDNLLVPENKNKLPELELNSLNSDLSRVKNEREI